MRGRRIAAVLLALVGSLPAAAQVNLGTDAQRAEGKQLYDKYCSQCHGLTGDGIGHATWRVLPRPRDFTAGKYKFRTTLSGLLPTDADVARVIKLGLPYTSMPGWPMFSDEQIQNIVYYLKTFSPEWQNSDRYGTPITIPDPPPMTDESVTRGRQVFEEVGCGACHGTLGRGDGLSAPTLADDQGNMLRPVDMTMRWTFRGGPTRQDIYRTFTTGVNGTPMPSYADSLSDEDRWHLVNYIYSLGDGDEPGYAELVTAAYVEDELALALDAEGGTSDVLTLFASASKARFPLMGQITEQGRNFYPSITSVEVRAVWNPKEIAFLLQWHDMRAERAGSNDPTLPVPPWDEDNPVPAAAGGDGGDFWGEEAAGGADEGDFWGEEVAEDEGDFWGEEEGGGGAAAAGFSDAVALQLPSQMPTGNRKPYFIFGDVQNSVDLWFLDLAGDRVQQYVGRGSQSIEPTENDEFQTLVHYDRGLWTVAIKRALRSTSNVTFGEEAFVPLAVSVWDGFNRERGNKRALSRWLYVYIEPAERVSPVGPMIKAGLLALVAELLAVLYIRRRKARAAAPEATPQVAR